MNQLGWILVLAIALLLLTIFAPPFSNLTKPFEDIEKNWNKMIKKELKK